MSASSFLSGIIYRHSAVLMIDLLGSCPATCSRKGPRFGALHYQAQDMSTIMFVETYSSDVEGLLGYRARTEQEQKKILKE